MDEKAFLRDTDLSSSAERQLQVAIQAAIDIGNHVIADKDLGPAKDYKDIFRVLAKHQIVSKPLSARLSLMTGLRNVLVHDYLDVDRRLVYRILKKDLIDFEKFIAAVLKLV
jgi:uncharacterized protein YutE (UPF0331/DUF86 family)